MDITNKIQELVNGELSPEDRYEIKLWERGRAFGSIPPHAREELQEMLEEYVRVDADALLAEDPANFESVRAKHAAARASAVLLTRFVEDVNQALAAATTTPAVFKRGMRHSQVPPDSL